MVRFFSKQNLSICLLFFTINVACYANTFEFAMSITLYEILEKEYISENKKNLNKYLSENSLESLITSAEKLDRKSQELLFFLYCYHIITENRTVWTDNKFIIVNDDSLLRIENLIKNTSSTEAWFALGFYQLQIRNYEKAISYLNKAKEAGHALAYLLPLMFTMVEQLKLPMSKIKENPEINVESVHQVLKEMKDRNITIFGFNILMGMVLFMKNEDTKAIVHFKNAIKNQESREFSTASMAYIGLIHDRNNRNQLAKKHFAKAIERGNDVVKARLLDIYLTEGDYMSSRDLLQEIATQWGKYNDTPSIKASFLISYMLAQGLGRTKDPIQSYVWATRAKTIYDISNNPHVWRVRIDGADRYILYSSIININPHITTTEVDILTHNKQAEHAGYTPKEIFDLMRIHNSEKTDITTEQLQIIEAQIASLTQELKDSKQLQLARLVSNNEFEKLHPLTSSCARTFH